MMRRVALALALNLAVTGGALATNPDLSAGGGGMNVLDSGRDAYWSEPPNLDGLIASSEIIGEIGLESEVANDFIAADDALILGARWWGGYFASNCLDLGYGAYWNLRFYNDGGCVPGEVIYESLGVFAHEVSIGCRFDLYPLFQYEAPVDLQVLGGAVYWFGAQCGDHVFPPQVGRLASEGVVNCESVFKSSFFAYPDWVSTIYVFGVEIDFSQEFEAAGSVPALRTTWGAVKGLYR